MCVQVQIWGKNVRTIFTLGQKCAPKFHFGAIVVRTIFTLGQKCAPKFHFGAIVVRTFFKCCAFIGHQLFRQISAFHFWETVGRALRYFHSLNAPNKHFTILETQNPPIDAYELQITSGSADFEALKVGRVAPQYFLKLNRLALNFGGLFPSNSFHCCWQREKWAEQSWW